MANIYVRLPHYIASYLRNRNENTSVEVGTPIRIDYGDPWYVAFQQYAATNIRNEVNMSCLTELQWMSMRKGRAIAFDRGMVPDIPQKKKDQPLTISEVYALCGKPELIRYDDAGRMAPDSEYPEEYVAFQMPRLITRNGRELRTHADWYMADPSSFIREIRRHFKMVFARFVANDKYRAMAFEALMESPTPLSKSEINRKRQRSRMESIDRFMLRYDIRYGEKERFALKKILTRDIKSDAFALDSDANHAKWIADNTEETVELPTDSCTAREVMVLETGKTYPSLGALIRALGFTVDASKRSHLTHAIKSGTRFHGVHVVYNDVPEKEVKQRASPDSYIEAMKRERGEAIEHDDDTADTDDYDDL